MNKYIPKESIDLILTSPPYSHLLNIIRKKFADKDFKGNKYKNQSRKLAKPYSSSNKDLGNLTYDDYIIAIKRIFKNLYTTAKEGCYNVWVVKDFRNIKDNIPYVNLHSDIINSAVKQKWILWDIVIWNQSNQRKLVRLGGNKSRRFYFNIGHTFVLVFRKNIENEQFKNFK